MKEQSELASSSVMVIVVDDDLAVRNSLKFSLEIEGLTVHSFATGAELLNAIDLALCDCLRYRPENARNERTGADREAARPAHLQHLQY